MAKIKEAMIEVVNRIPYGYVTNYGSIAEIVREMTESRISAQMIWRQLSGLPEHERDILPRWRVIAKNGSISTLKLGDKGWKQIQLLEKEGIKVLNNTVDMEIYAVDTLTQLKK